MLLKIKTQDTITYYNSQMQLHRDNDKPAVIWSYGHQYWYKDGKLHRNNGPAVIYASGDKECYKDGKLHKN